MTNKPSVYFVLGFFALAWAGGFARAETGGATPVEKLTLLPGFKAELLHSAGPGEGSWASMAIDSKGRLIISPQFGTNNLLRITPSRNGQMTKVEKIDLPVGAAMGLLCVGENLYVNGMGPQGTGIYRLRATRHKDEYDSVELIRSMDKATGEHGSHAVVLGPDKHLYIISGNYTKAPKDLSSDSPLKHYGEDQLLPPDSDHAGDGPAPSGFLLRMDMDGRKTELFAGGMRNTYDFAFNPDGEMFGFDSDMELDWGMPWYRPIRIYHIVSGGDYGFRGGTGKWPKYYPDSLPSTVDVGIGSPTGLKFGTDSKFPDRYKKALFALDWSYGRIFAVHFTPKGASYDATFEQFLEGKPLNLTDIEFGKDGAMYFITGGRDTEAGLYRVTYTGPKQPMEPAPGKEERKAAGKARELRHKLESFHGKKDPKAVDFAWPYLDSADRFIQYAARVAIESQPAAEWQDRALAETRPKAGINGLLALARCGSRETQASLLQALDKFNWDNLSETEKLDKLRVIEVSFIRQGRPGPELAKMETEQLDRQYPAKSEPLNYELSELLIYLEAPDVVEKTLALLEAASTQEEQIHYIFYLRKLKNGWTLEQRRHYFSWFNTMHEGGMGVVNNHTAAYYPWSRRVGKTRTPKAELLKWFSDAGREYGDGANFPKFIAAFRKEAVDSLSPQERAELEPYIMEKQLEVAAKSAVEHKFIKEWKMEDLQPSLENVSKGRSFVNGREAFVAAQCITCHRLGNEGGSVGPDLTAVASRFSSRDILESILEPSKVVSEQYKNTLIIRKNGEDATGRIAEENDSKVVLIVDALSQAKLEIPQSDIQNRRLSDVSPMPEGLVNNFTKEEILDLIAYLEAGGKQTAAMFKNPASH